MDRNDARIVLEQGKAVCFEGWTWQNFVYECGCNEGDYTCCYETFANIEDMLDHIDSMCGNWEEVY